MGPIGIQEMIGLFILALLLFGPKELPKLGRTLGKALSEFRRAKNELKSTFDMHMRELEREARIEEAKTQQDKTRKLEPAGPAAMQPTANVEPGVHDSGLYNPPSYASSYSYEDNSGSPYGATSSPYEEAVAAPAPVMPHAAGTVARSNGVAPVGPSGEAAESQERN